MEIGSFVKQERTRRGLTQQQLADMAGVGLNFVYQLEKNKPTVQLDKANQVLHSLGYAIGAIRCFDPWAELKPNHKSSANDLDQRDVKGASASA